jgi:hypothetical protein
MESNLPSVPPDGGYDFHRCHRCGWLDRVDFFKHTIMLTDGAGACRKCGHDSSIEPLAVLITKEERARIASGFYDNYTEL